MMAAVAVSAGSAPSLASVSFEIPKSSSFTHGAPSARRVTNRFEGLRSRWTMPAACTSASASHACSAISHASSTASGPPFRSASRSAPSRCSITRNGVPSFIVPTSLTRATWSLFTRAATRASRRKRSTASALRLASGSRNLMATR